MNFRTIAESWEIIRSHLSENAPDVMKTFKGGASESEISLLKSEIPDVPEGLIQFLQLANGQSGDLQEVFFFNYMKFYSVNEIIEHLRMNLATYDTVPHSSNYSSDDNPVTSVRTDLPWRPGWIPFMGTMGQEVFVDTEPTELGERGQVVMCEYTVVQEPDYSAFNVMMHAIADAFERGQASYDDGCVELTSVFYED